MSGTEDEIEPVPADIARGLDASLEDLRLGRLDSTEEFLRRMDRRIAAERDRRARPRTQGIA